MQETHKNQNQNQNPYLKIEKEDLIDVQKGKKLNRGRTRSGQTNQFKILENKQKTNKKQ